MQVNIYKHRHISRINNLNWIQWEICYLSSWYLWDLEIHIFWDGW